MFCFLGATVFYPADAVSCERAIELAANTKGICFIRTSRPATAVIYKNDEVFTVIIVLLYPCLSICSLSCLVFVLLLGMKFRKSLLVTFCREYSKSKALLTDV